MIVETINKNNLNTLLKKATDLLDITQYQYEEAEKHYKAVGKFLGDCPKISHYSPEVFPQGSFRLGTVVRPLKDGEEYDIDLVCQLNATHEEFTQKSLKKIIGDRLKEPQYNKQLQPESRRCWRLNYAEGTKFHLDVLPAIPDNETKRILESLEFSSNSYHNSAISITDNLDTNYNSYTRDWPKSNPVGYTEWFKNQMKVVLNESLKTFASMEGVQIDEIPFYRVKTPLQRAIQILKRHRDLLFGNNEDKPISIIITTLSAKAYKNEANIYDALIGIINNMHLYIKSDENGNDIVENPVDPRENFADKWIEYPIRKENFYTWLERVRMDFETILDKTNLKDLRENLNNSLGENITSKVLAENNKLVTLNENLNLAMRNPRAIDFSPNEQFIQEQYRVNIIYDLKLGCKVTQKGFRDKLLKELYILKRNHSLKFYIEHHNVPGYYSVKWKVRNCGIKAKSHGVRGQILNDDGTETRKENSSFYGKHYVECYIIKDNVCVAMDRIDVPISGILN